MTLPDPNLRWNPERGHYDFGEIDWEEFYQVVRGDGPCNRQRMEHRVRAFEEGQWVREAAMAYAASISRRLSPKQHDPAGEESTDNEPTPQAQRSADKQQNSQPEGSDFQAEGGHGAVPTEGVATRGPQPVPAGSWPLWEVFVRAVAACLTITWEACTPDATMALRNARDVYTPTGGRLDLGGDRGNHGSLTR